MAEANVTLISFDVTRSTTSPIELNLSWETGSETGTVGFRVKRSITSNLQEATSVATKPSEGSATSGETYEWTNSGLTTGRTYYYWLYELKDDGTEDLITPIPKSETPGGESSPTNVPTATATQLPTNTPTVINTSQTPTNVPTPRGTDRVTHAHGTSNRHAQWRCADPTTDQHVCPGSTGATDQYTCSDCAGTGDRHAGCFCSHSYRRGSNA